MENKYKFSAVLSSLTDFVNENTGLLAKSVTSADTIKFKLPNGMGITFLDGMVGDSIKLNLVQSDIYWQDGNSCTFTTSGNTNFTQKSIDLDQVKYTESLCGFNFMPKWYGMVTQGQYSDGNIHFMDLIMNEKIQVQTYEIEKAIWQGNKTSGSGNLALVNGLIKNLSGSTLDTYVSSAISGGTHTAANILSHVDAMIAARPDRLVTAQNQVLFMGYSDYMLYLGALKTANLFVVADTSEFFHKYPFSNVYVVATSGLGSLRTWYLTTNENVTVVTNTIDELYRIKAVKDVVNEDTKLITRFVLGAGFADEGLVVHNNSAL